MVDDNWPMVGTAMWSCDGTPGFANCDDDGHNVAFNCSTVWKQLSRMFCEEVTAACMHSILELDRGKALIFMRSQFLPFPHSLLQLSINLPLFVVPGQN